MNWIFALLGLPVGMLLYEIGWRLQNKLKAESVTIQGLVLALPIGIFCVIVTFVDILFCTCLLDMAVGMFSFSVTCIIFAIVLKGV